MSTADVVRETTIARALASAGSSESSGLYALVRELVAQADARGVVVDVGCGRGALYAGLQGLFSHYVGIDVVRHAGFPEAPDVTYVNASLDDGPAGLPEGIADVLCCVETIEHVENPRLLVRCLSRLAKPGCRLIISTPNQLSLLSKLCLVLKNEFVHFQERPGCYPAHLSALLECDLLRIAREAGWVDISTQFSGEGRMPGTATRWPAWLASRNGWRGRAFSDNVVLTARTPSSPVTVRGT